MGPSAVALSPHRADVLAFARRSCRRIAPHLAAAPPHARRPRARDPCGYPARRDPPAADIRRARQTPRDRRARLLARKPERHCLLGFDRPQAALLAADIV